MEDVHKGVAETEGVKYCYKHTDAPTEPESECYRIKCHSLHFKNPKHENIYFVPGEKLNDFLERFYLIDERVLDIRPVTKEEMEDEISEYKEGKQIDVKL